MLFNSLEKSESEYAKIYQKEIFPTIERTCIKNCDTLPKHNCEKTCGRSVRNIGHVLRNRISEWDPSQSIGEYFHIPNSAQEAPSTGLFGIDVLSLSGVNIMRDLVWKPEEWRNLMGNLFDCASMIGISSEELEKSYRNLDKLSIESMSTKSDILSNCIRGTKEGNQLHLSGLRKSIGLDPISEPFELVPSTSEKYFERVFNDAFDILQKRVFTQRIERSFESIQQNVFSLRDKLSAFSASFNNRDGVKDVLNLYLKALSLTRCSLPSYNGGSIEDVSLLSSTIQFGSCIDDKTKTCLDDVKRDLGRIVEFYSKDPYCMQRQKILATIAEINNLRGTGVIASRLYSFVEKSLIDASYVPLVAAIVMTCVNIVKNPKYLRSRVSLSDLIIDLKPANTLAEAILDAEFEFMRRFGISLIVISSSPGLTYSRLFHAQSVIVRFVSFGAQEWYRNFEGKHAAHFISDLDEVELQYVSRLIFTINLRRMEMLDAGILQDALLVSPAEWLAEFAEKYSKYPHKSLGQNDGFDPARLSPYYGNRKVLPTTDHPFDFPAKLLAIESGISKTYEGLWNCRTMNRKLNGGVSLWEVILRIPSKIRRMLPVRELSTVFSLIDFSERACVKAVKKLCLSDAELPEQTLGIWINSVAYLNTILSKPEIHTDLTQAITHIDTVLSAIEQRTLIDKVFLYQFFTYPDSSQSILFNPVRAGPLVKGPDV